LINSIKLIEKEKEEEEKLKIYCVEIHKRNYLPGQGTDIFVNKHKFSSIEECEYFISKLKIGITEISKYREENTIECVKILLNTEIIKTFDKKTIEVKQTDYEERINIVLNNYNTILINEERIILDKWLGFLRKILSNESLSDEDKKYIEDTNTPMDPSPEPISEVISEESSPVRIAQRNVFDISSLVPELSPEHIAKILFENVSAIELSISERHDTIEGINQKYSIISNLSEIRNRKLDDLGI
jgi:hypothetical protein